MIGLRSRSQTRSDNPVYRVGDKHVRGPVLKQPQVTMHLSPRLLRRTNLLTEHLLATRILLERLNAPLKSTVLLCLKGFESRLEYQGFGTPSSRSLAAIVTRSARESAFIFRIT
jgi:hypothetical protein